MVLSPLHKLAQMIRSGEPIEDGELIRLLGEDGIVVVPLQGGGERHLPSGEIMSVLADGAGVSLEQVLARSFRLNPSEIETAREFYQLVQFSGGTPEAAEPGPAEQPIQPFDT